MGRHFCFTFSARLRFRDTRRRRRQIGVAWPIPIKALYSRRRIDGQHIWFTMPKRETKISERRIQCYDSSAGFWCAYNIIYYYVNIKLSNTSQQFYNFFNSVETTYYIRFDFGLKTGSSLLVKLVGSASSAATTIAYHAIIHIEIPFVLLSNARWMIIYRESC